MKTVICKTQPFVQTQIFYIYDDTNELIETISFTSENIENKINELLTKYRDIKDIDIYGSSMYNMMIKQKIETFELSKFSINKVNVNLK